MRLGLKPRVLVTGARGFIGRHVVRRFASEGYPVVAVSRSSDCLAPSRVTLAAVPNISASTLWRDLLRDVEIVVHCAAHVPSFPLRSGFVDPRFQQVNVDGTQALALQATEAGVQRFIFLSSIKVHGDYTLPGNVFNEGSPSAPADAYGRSKNAAEEVLREVASATEMGWVILRPPLVYGAGAKGGIAALARWISRGLPIPLGAVTDNSRSFIGVDNLVDAICHCAEHPSASQRTFIVSDGEDLSTTDLLCALGQAFGRPAHLVRVPPKILRAAAAVFGQEGLAKRFLGSLQVDSSQIHAVTGWYPPECVEEGFRRMAETMRGQA